MQKIPLAAPSLNDDELKNITEVLQSGQLSAGEFTATFESLFADTLGVSPSSVMTCQSGTAALHLILLELGIGPGDAVLLPTLTYISGVNPICYVGAEPIFMDSEKDSLGVDPQKLRRYLEDDCDDGGSVLTDRELNKTIKALIVMHPFGDAANLPALMEIAERYDLPVIEDAAEAVGCRYDSGAGALSGRALGTNADFGFFSFNANKIITAAGGGAIFCADEERLSRMRHLAGLAKTPGTIGDFDAIGYSYGLSNLQAAIGVAQLQKLDAHIAAKRRHYELYIKEGIDLRRVSRHLNSNCWYYGLWAENPAPVVAALAEANIEARLCWKPSHRQKPFAHCKAFEIEVADAAAAHLINLPCGVGLSDDEVRRVAAVVKAAETNSPAARPPKPKALTGIISLENGKANSLWPANNHRG